MKRTRLNPVSDKRKEVNRQRKEAMLEHFGKRETWVCSVREIIGTPCFGDVNGHEILSRARSGQSDKNLLDMSGIILVCNHHNSWIEDNPKKAYELGLTKHAWDD
jgi:precorrin-3B methylase